ncbi:TAXI family TRAP transporter solute-binding subunit [Polynucleobacter campilacus]|uniref:TAXI family TRAP transporter solute-binding subunit n=1 Tax=Polynucleobacter campilacus TaxID=1743163 RepID=UPI00197D4346|nr:TAXI family TRAP transporter solute-binding subunit [Polynucleobacter campilacus]
MSDRNDPLQVAFVQAGFVSTKDTAGIQSLGVIAYNPIWFFYRGSELNSKELHGVDRGLKYFLTKKISIGVEGSGTYAQAIKLLKLSGYEPGPDFVNLPGDQAVKAIQNGEIDGVFMVDAYYSPNIQTLLKDPTLQIGTFQRAGAYAKLEPYLQVLNVSEGAFDLKRNFPRADIKMLATTTNLLIDDRMHPAIQFLFL